MSLHAQVSETDLIDIVKRLRSHINQLDNIHFLANKCNIIQDNVVNISINNIVVGSDELANNTAKFLRLIESSDLYKSILKKYRPNRAAGHNEDETEETDGEEDETEE